MAAYTLSRSGNSILANYTVDGVARTSEVFKFGNLLYGLSGTQAGGIQQLRNYGIEGADGLEAELAQYLRGIRTDENNNPIDDVPTLPDIQDPSQPVPQAPANLQPVVRTPADYAGDPAQALDPNKSPGAISGGTGGSSSGSGAGGGSGASGAGSTYGFQNPQDAINNQLSTPRYNFDGRIITSLQLTYEQAQAQNTYNSLLQNLKDGIGGGTTRALVEGLLNQAQLGQNPKNNQSRLDGDMLRRNKGKIGYDETKTFNLNAGSALLGTPTLLGN